MMDAVDILIVNCAFDIGLTPTTLFRSDMYRQTRRIVALLRLSQGDPADAFYEGMPELERDLVAIFSEYMQAVYQSTMVR